jgi:hypothetical protein
MLTKQISMKVRLVLAPIVLAGSVVLVARATQSLGITLDPESVTGFVESQQGLEDRFGSGTDLRSLPLPLKILSLLFRPFYIDSNGMTGYAASLENTALLYFCLYILYHWRLLIRLARNVFYVIYFLVFDAALILSLSLVNYNIGMGQRMKMMAVPGILIIYGTIFIYRRVMAAQAQLVAEAPQPPLEQRAEQPQPQPL